MSGTAAVIASLRWGAPSWLVPAAVAMVLAVVVLWLGYRRSAGSTTTRWSAAVLKALAIGLLAICLIEPLWHGEKPRPRANLFLVLADNSVSLAVRDRAGGPTRGEQLRDALGDTTPWLTRLGQDFDVRRYVFDERMSSVATFRELAFAGSASTLGNSLAALAERFRDRPVAGILVLTDGIATDTLPSSRLPPVFPVLLGEPERLRDVRVEHVAASESNFQSAPILINASVAADGVQNQQVVVQLLNEAGHVEQEETWQVERETSRQFAFRFRPTDAGAEFYTVQAFLRSELSADAPTKAPARSSEATLDNNQIVVRVDAPRGPYRVLYVSGRPNWELKFLRRAVQRDEEVQLVSLVRIAKREAKFDFRGHKGESTNPLFRGFDPEDQEQTERYDQPVLLRVGVDSADELRDGFPKQADELFKYDAVILDDLEAEFFTGDQLALLHKFVSGRGGGLLLLGGAESFVEGGYPKTPLAELAPIYLRAATDDGAYFDPGEAIYRLDLTREGWLQPWVRLRGTEDEERDRLAAMPAFAVRNAVGAPKPGATVLLTALDQGQRRTPALVAQRFGRGRTAALLIGDLWRWTTRRTDPKQHEDFEYQWVQLVRWLVADVPRRVEIERVRLDDQPGQPMQLGITVRDATYEPIDNAQVRVTLVGPDGEELDLQAEPSDAGGTYVLRFVSREAGPYRATVRAILPDGEELPPRATGWVHAPLVEELQSLRPNERGLQALAEQTGGELLRPQELNRFVQSLATRKVPVTEPWVYPIWHRWPVFLLACLCLIGEWGLRRLRGLP